MTQRFAKSFGNSAAMLLSWVIVAFREFKPTDLVLPIAAVMLSACGGGAGNAGDSGDALQPASSSVNTSSEPPMATLYVSPAGRDDNPGTVEKPMGSLSSAIAILLAKAPGGLGGKQILLADGTYHLEHPVVLNAAASGEAGRPFLIAAAPGARPVLSGAEGVRLEWTAGADGTWTAKLPGDVIAGLTVNGEAQVRARYPNFDPDTTKGGKFFNGFSADAIAPARVAKWKNPVGGWLHAMQGALWGDMHFEILGKNADATLKLGPGIGNNRASLVSQAHATARYVENILEELDAPREWYHDAKAGILYWKPPAGVDPRGASVEVTRLESLLQIIGSEAAPVHDVAVRGLVLTQTAPTFMKTNEPLLRSDWKIYRGGAIFLEGTKNVEISSNDIRDVGGNGIFVSGYNRNTMVTGNEFVQIGASAIAFVGKPEAVRNPLFEYGQSLDIKKIDRTPGPQTNDYPAQSTVENNLIHWVGRMEKQSAGVQISMASEIIVRSNSIYDVPRAGINVNDGTWGGHLIEFNDVFRTVLETGDHGAFNSWGRDRFWSPNRGTMNAINAAEPTLPFLDAIKPITLRNNRWRCDHGWDVDLDDGSSNYVIENNVMLNRGLKNREGFKRINRNNIIVNSGYQPHAWFENSQDRFEHNIVLGSYGPVFMPTTAKWGDSIDNNLFATLAGLQSAQGYGVDANSIYGNPKFVDAAAGNYSVAADSPALGVGFVNFPMDRFGVQDSRLKAKADKPVISSINIVDMVLEKPTTFAGASVKSVQTDGEQSAVGLPTIAGVLILNVPPDTDAQRAGLQPNDAITKAVVEEKVVVVRNVADLNAARSREVSAGKLRLTVMHNQSEVSMTVVFTAP